MPADLGLLPLLVSRRNSGISATFEPPVTSRRDWRTCDLFPFYSTIRDCSTYFIHITQNTRNDAFVGVCWVVPLVGVRPRATPHNLKGSASKYLAVRWRSCQAAAFVAVNH